MSTPSQKKIRVKVLLPGDLTDISKQVITLEIPEDLNLKELLTIIRKKFGQRSIGGSNEYEWRHGSREAIIQLNNNTVNAIDFPNYRIQDGDTIKLITPIAGG